MNHDLGAPLEQKQFVEIRKISGTTRSGSKLFCASFFKKYFKNAKPDGLVYFTRLKKGKFMITEHPYSVNSYEKRILSANGTLKIYCNEDEILHGSYYSFYECSIGLIMQPSSLKEIEMRIKTKKADKSGLLLCTQTYISIQNADLPFFDRTGYRVEVFQGSNLYMKITKIPVDEIQRDKNLKSLSKNEMEKEYFSYDELELVRRKQLYIPPTFLENTSMYRGDYFTLKKVDDDTMFVIPKLQKDEITNEFFDPFEKKRKIVTLKQKENEEIKSIQRIKSQTKFDLAGMLEEMRKINNQI